MLGLGRIGQGWGRRANPLRPERAGPGREGIGREKRLVRRASPARTGDSVAKQEKCAHERLQNWASLCVQLAPCTTPNRRQIRAITFGLPSLALVLRRVFDVVNGANRTEQSLTFYKSLVSNEDFFNLGKSPTLFFCNHGLVACIELFLAVTTTAAPEKIVPSVACNDGARRRVAMRRRPSIRARPALAPLAAERNCRAR